MTEDYKRMSDEDWKREYISRFAGLSDKELRKDLRERIVLNICYHPDFATRELLECLYDEIKNGFFKEIKHQEYARGYEDGRRAAIQERKGGEYEKVNV